MAKEIRTNASLHGFAGAPQGIVNELFSAGGVSFKNLTWKIPANSQTDSSAVILQICLDLLQSGKVQPDTANQLRSLWPEGCWPFVISARSAWLHPGISSQAAQEILKESTKPGIDVKMHSIRLAADDNPDFDRLLFSSSLPIGDERLTIGVAFANDSDRDDLAHECLLALLGEFELNRTLLTTLDHRRVNSDLAQILIDPKKQETIWRNPSASANWNDYNRFADYLLHARSNNDGDKNLAFESTEETAEQTSELALVLITFLRSKVDTNPSPKIVDAETSNQLSAEAKDTEVSEFIADSLPESVRTRIERVIELPNELGYTVDSLESEHTVSRGLARELVADAHSNENKNSDPTEDSTEAQDNPTNANSPVHESEKNSASEKTDRKDKQRSSQSKTALQIALSRLPEGGKLKLSRDDFSGEMFYESLDKTGEQLVKISLEESAENSPKKANNVADHSA